MENDTNDTKNHNKYRIRLKSFVYTFMGLAKKF
jgi:hypothetical protein